MPFAFFIYCNWCNQDILLYHWDMKSKRKQYMLPLFSSLVILYLQPLFCFFEDQAYKPRNFKTKLIETTRWNRVMNSANPKIMKNCSLQQQTTIAEGCVTCGKFHKGQCWKLTGGGPGNWNKRQKVDKTCSGPRWTDLCTILVSRTSINYFITRAMVSDWPLGVSLYGRVFSTRTQPFFCDTIGC